MAEFRLPANSRVQKGKTWPARGKRSLEFRIYRWSPDTASNPRMDTYFVDESDCGPMILDGLKHQGKGTRLPEHGSSISPFPFNVPAICRVSDSWENRSDCLLPYATAS